MCFRLGSGSVKEVLPVDLGRLILIELMSTERSATSERDEETLL